MDDDRDATAIVFRRTPESALHLYHPNLWSMVFREQDSEDIALECTGVHTTSSIDEDERLRLESMANAVFDQGTYLHHLTCHQRQHPPAAAAAEGDRSPFERFWRRPRPRLPAAEDWWQVSKTVDDVQLVHLHFQDPDQTEVNLRKKQRPELRLGFHPGGSLAAEPRTVLCVPLRSIQLERPNSHTDLYRSRINICIRHKDQPEDHPPLTLGVTFEVKCSSLHYSRTYLTQVTLSAHPHVLMMLLSKRMEVVGSAGVPSIM